MILAIAYCVRDSSLALRLVRWIEFLSGQGNSMQNEGIVLMTPKTSARTPTHASILESAKRTFGRVGCHVPATEYEKGWPASANWMFQQTLEHVERVYKEDMLWVEPDAVPVTVDWYSRICAEFNDKARPAGKEFLGGRVPHATPHMTGNAVYGRNWRKVAPSLVDNLNGAFDVNAAQQTLPACLVTNLIQQIWRPIDIKTSMLAKDAVLFHQCKTGKLIELLDRERFKGEFGRNIQTMDQPKGRAYFYVSNSGYPVKTFGLVFRFKKTRFSGGVYAGVYATDNETEIHVLRACRLVREITREEYDKSVAGAR